MYFYAIKQQGTEKYMCFFETKKRRDAKVLGRPEFTAVDGKTAYKILRHCYGHTATPLNWSGVEDFVQCLI